MRGTRTDARRRRHNRVRKTVYGSSERPRLAVYRSNRYIYAQIIDDDAGRTLAAASSQEKKLRKKTLTVDTAAEVGKLGVHVYEDPREGLKDVDVVIMHDPRHVSRDSARAVIADLADGTIEGIG